MFQVRTWNIPRVDPDRERRKTIMVSDLTGRENDEREGATVTIKYSDARRSQVGLDVNAEEVNDLAAQRKTTSKTWLASEGRGVARL